MKKPKFTPKDLGLVLPKKRKPRKRRPAAVKVVSGGGIETNRRKH